jgi:hypothetical protein
LVCALFSAVTLSQQLPFVWQGVNHPSPSSFTYQNAISMVNATTQAFKNSTSVNEKLSNGKSVFIISSLNFCDIESDVMNVDSVRNPSPSCHLLLTEMAFVWTIGCGCSQI